MFPLPHLLPNIVKKEPKKKGFGFKLYVKTVKSKGIIRFTFESPVDPDTLPEAFKDAPKGVITLGEDEKFSMLRSFSNMVLRQLAEYDLKKLAEQGVDVVAGKKSQ